MSDRDEKTPFPAILHVLGCRCSENVVARVCLPVEPPVLSREKLDVMIDAMTFAGSPREKQVFDFGAFALRDAILESAPVEGREEKWATN